MLSPDDIKALGLRKYPAVLRAIAAGEDIFPMPIRFGQPSPTADWSVLQREITALAAAEAATGYTIGWEEKNTRRWGRQRLPIEVRFAAEADYLRMLGKTAEVQRFRANLAAARAKFPQLEAWLVAHAPRVVEYADDWPRLLLVCDYLLRHPRPGLYARELPVAVDSKFVETRRPILRSLLDALLPASAIDAAAETFEQRYGLRYEEPLVRLRLLDPALAVSLALPVDDLATPLSRLRALPWPGLPVLIVENKMTFLTLPPLAGTIAIWGAGNAAALLADVPWLRGCRLVYWGDLDVHGFHILARLREAFPSVRSVMMDESTLADHLAYHVPSPEAAYEAIETLSDAERRVYERLRAERIVLEQEKIPHAYAVDHLRREIL